ncbi:MAG TPA: hypothetical protein VFA05_08200 [Gaiellaceae bacterium]|nr:hypothetical protein [Gaiellaceae bacterium]
MKRLALLVLVLVCALPASAARLPILAPHDWWPTFSPNASYVAFTELNGQGRAFTLEVVDVSTPRHPVRRLAQAAYQLMPSWSPDSTQLAYQAGGHIWTVGVDGSGRKELAVGLYPAWSPDGATIAFVQGGVVHAGAARFGRQVIGVPAWSPDGSSLAFTQSDGIYVATVADGTVRRVARPVQEVRDVSWSPDGKLLAYASGGYVYDVAADGSAAPQRIAGPFYDIGRIVWSSAGDEVAYDVRGLLELTSFEGGVHTQPLAKTNGVGVSFAPHDPQSRVLVYSGPDPRCPGHDAILQHRSGVVAGTCAITGTAGADVIDGTANGGDVIAAGPGDDVVHAKNGRRDTVDCGAGRDTVYADRTDRLRRCEVVRR